MIEIGLIAVGRSGSRGIVLDASDSVLTLDCGGEIRQVARDAVIFYESPSTPERIDPYPVGTRVYLRSWFTPFDSQRFKPEWFTVIQPCNAYGLYLLQSDSGLWAGLGEFQIKRDAIKIQEIE